MPAEKGRRASLTYLLPERRADEYTWPGLRVAKSDLAGRGVFATRALAKGTCIAIVGKAMTAAEVKRELAEDEGTVYLFTAGNAKTVNGDPAIEPSRQKIGCKGLAIIMLINEPKAKTQANVAFVGWYACLTRDVEQGTELTAHYGSDYARDYKVGRRARLPTVKPHGAVRADLQALCDKMFLQE